jgi:23S rRNA (uridine2552-2'-O)-methyltransferase
LEERLTGGLLIAIDPLPITSVDRTRVIEGFAGELRVDEEIERVLAGLKLDLVLSDMAPNISGVRAVDQARSMELADVSLDSCHRWMSQHGAMAIKAFQGEGLDAWVKDLKFFF